MLFTLVYGDKVRELSEWAKKAKKWNTRAKIMFDTMNLANTVCTIASKYLYPAATPFLSSFGLFITVISSGIDAIEHASEEYEAGIITEDKFAEICRNMFTGTCATKIGLSELVKELTGRFADPITLIMKFGGKIEPLLNPINKAAKAVRTKVSSWMQSDCKVS
jgi:hypothetical protein